jgi:surfeit locus 1 family protein
MPTDLLRPRAILSHLVVLTVAATLMTLGLWQLDRLATLRASNALLEERLTAPAVDVAELAPTAAAGELDEAALEFRRAEATGVYRTDEEVLQRGQQHPFSGQPGFHVLTPLELDDGAVVLVRRGWVPATLDDPPVAEAAPPVGQVQVSGVLERSVPQPGFGPRDAEEGRLLRVFHADTDRLDAQIAGELLPMVLRVDEPPPTSSATDQLPVSAGPPVFDERNHFSYAMQWFSFAVLAVATYGAWLFTRVRRRRSAAVLEQRPGPGGGQRGTEPLEGVDVGGRT